MDRKVVGFFIITFFLLIFLSIANVFFSMSVPIFGDKFIYILLGINFLILLAFFFRKHTIQRWLKILHKITIALFSLALIIYLSFFLVNQFHELSFINLNYILIGIFALGLLSALSYYKEEKTEITEEEKRIKTNWLIYLVAITASAIISAFLFFKIKYGLLAFFIPSIAFVILSFLFIILALIFMRNKTIMIKKDYIFMAFLVLIAGIITFFKTKGLGWPLYAIIAVIGITCGLIVLISVLLLEQERFSPERR